uniref:Uncharacterized protein n=1 Tax=Daphnia magna TaxID=35525 RepID=A0A0P6A5R5_9CRUS
MADPACSVKPTKRSGHERRHHQSNKNSIRRNATQNKHLEMVSTTKHLETARLALKQPNCLIALGHAEISIIALQLHKSWH